MSYLDESGLSTYDSNLKEWISSQESKTITSSIYPWTKTVKAGAVSCYPVGGTELKPVVDFLFTETPPASGDKGPSNPSTIAGVSYVKVTRCGKNLCPLVGESSSSYISVSFTDNGEFVFNGSYVGVVNVYVFNAIYDVNLFPDYLERGKTYTFSLQGDNSSVSFEVYKLLSGTNYGGAVVSIATGESQTYTIPNTQSMILRFKIPANTVLDNAKFKLQIEEGSSATEFEPYAGTNYTIQLGDTYYGGTLDAATGVMTVTHYGVVFDGVNVRATDHPGTIGTDYRHGITLSTQNFPKASPTPSSTNQASTHFTYLNRLVGVFGTYVVSGNYIIIHDKDGLYPNSTSFNSWLASQYSAGTPVAFVYTVETPFTVQLTPTEILSLTQTDKYTPRLNTVYTDASAVQVGYVKSPIREEQELTQAIVAQGGEI